MSNNPLQRIADLEAQLADTTAEKEELGKLLQAAKTMDIEGLAIAIAAAVDASLVKNVQYLREDFVGKFAAHFEPIIERTTNRMSGLEKRLDEAEVDQDGVERRLRQHLGEIEERLTGFSISLESHHSKNDAALGLLWQHVQASRTLAQVTVDAAGACKSFRSDYEATVAKAEDDRGVLAKRIEGEVTAFARAVTRRLRDTVEPTLKEMERQGRSQFRRQVEWLSVFALGALIMFGVMWMASPSGSTVLDAARWRKWQQGYSQEQIDRLNKVFAEIEAEEQGRERANNR